MKRKLEASARVAVVAAACLAAWGCNRPSINPFADSAEVPADAMTTASAEAIHQSGKAAVIRVRDWPESSVSAEDGTVTHWPVWWEDPFVDKGSDDGRVAWTWEDLLAFGYGPARFVLNTVALPVSAVVTPPGTVLCSDGKISKQLVWRDHDATVCREGHPGPDAFVPVAARPSAALTSQPANESAGPVSDLNNR